MDASTTLPFPVASSEGLERDLAEIEVAIGLIEHGLARRIRLVGLTNAEAAAGEGLAMAQDAGVMFALERSPEGSTSLVLGPGGQRGR